MPNGNRSINIAGGATLLTVVVVIAVLYFARTVFIPLALAVLLAFLLAPLAIRLRHWGLGRGTSAAIVVLFSFLVLAITGTVMASQLTDLAHKLPGYQQNVRHKLESIRASGGGLVQRASRLVQSVTAELTPGPGTSGQPNEEKPVPVEIRRTPFSPIELIQKVLGSVLSVLLTGGIVVVFAIFMLVQREDLRDRLIRLAGEGRINVTTQLLDDATHRVSRYLLAQLGVNAAFGLLAGVGLAFMHVPNPLLWGILAALFRYIPYLGIWIAAVMPACIAFAVEPGWLRAPGIFALYFGIDLFMYNLIEPLLYGSSTGISPIAILVAAVFWTWLWGAVGLLLATPLTVCVVVIGRYVPSLQFLSVMLSDEEVLPPETRFYQRLLAMDLEEATDVAEQYLKGKSLAALYDAVIIPALSLAEEDRHRGKLDEARQKFIFHSTRLLIEDLADRADDLISGNGSSRSRLTPPANRALKPALAEPKSPAVWCIPARDEADEIAALMLVQLLNQRGIEAKGLPIGANPEEAWLEGAVPPGAKVACVSAVPPFGFMHARHVCRRLQSHFHQLKLVAAILTEHDVEEIRQRQPGIAADSLASSLQQALQGIAAVLKPSEPPPPPQPAQHPTRPCPARRGRRNPCRSAPPKPPLRRQSTCACRPRSRRCTGTWTSLCHLPSSAAGCSPRGESL